MIGRKIFKVASAVALELGGALLRLRVPAARPIGKLGLREKLDEFVRRVRRGGLIFLALVGGLILYSLILAPIPLLLWILALPLSVMAAGLSLLWPSRRGRAPHPPLEASADVPGVAGRIARWLSVRRRLLPPAALPAADAILGSLEKIAGMTARLDGLLEAEAQRLMTAYLPRLVDSYLALPPAERRPQSEASVHLVDGLSAIAGELDELAGRMARTSFDRFDVQRRFVEMRFQHGAGLKAR